LASSNGTELSAIHDRADDLKPCTVAAIVRRPSNIDIVIGPKGRIGRPGNTYGFAPRSAS
jgi:hypothetical protein